MRIFVLLICILTFVAPVLAQVRVCPEEGRGEIRHMNGVNNGPVMPREDQIMDNFNEYKALGIPFARTHDSNFYYGYGAPHNVDITAIFPDFSKSASNPASYDFTLTDRYLQSIMSAGTQVFFRLGQGIEHNPKKYGIYPPKDFKKWASICEHIIRHYNEGWADGYHMGIRYWEIWNEPDLDTERWQREPQCWGGSPEQFFSLFETAATHLKKCFPDLMIGGPAISHNLEWADRFLAHMSRKKVAFDFFSWHCYCNEPAQAVERSAAVRKLLDSYGYSKAESILDEWNYIKGWTREFRYSLKTISSIKGAAFTSAMMSACQDTSTDMLMYYDFQPWEFNGAFELRSGKPMVGYYPFYAWKRLKEYGRQIKAESSDSGIYVTASESQDGSLRILVTRYSDDDDITAPKVISVEVEGVRDGEVIGHITDSARKYTEIPLKTDGGKINVRMEPLSFVVIEIGSDML